MNIIDKFNSLKRSENTALFSQSMLIQLSGYAISLALTPLAIAFYTPAQFGMFAVVIFVANLFGTFGGFKLEWAVINEHSNNIVNLLLNFCASLLLFWGFAILIGAWLLPEKVFAAFNIDRNAIFFAAPIALVTGLGIFWQAFGIRLRRYQDVYLARNTVMVSRQLVQIGLGLFWPSITALLLAEVVSRAAGIQILLTRLQTRLRFLAPKQFVRFFGPIVPQRYGHYAKVALPSSLATFIMTSSLAVLIVPLYGVEVAGAYWLVQRIFGIPVALIGNVAADLFQGQIARRADKHQIVSHMRQMTVLLGGFALLIMPTGALAFWFLTQRFYDGKWALSGELALYFIPAVCIQFVTSPLSRVLIVLKKMNYKYVFDAILFSGLLIWGVTTVLGYLSFTQSIGLLVSVQTLAYLAYMWICFYLVRNAI
ncbi:oligosaccharide flippase family protein [Devosia rhodophyticola]|uniref:Oligosaccharide flippase family protein n=1 Tax=Devosia rhodophyticola TaxID=3026423 RepID=A0ABY7YZ81_9HYPH|nr:oligosaccharide flippase family protein [Devosia rhodophyticola]WDR06698.1 oligosaccharide flippase family protein [Devosia rhodophyticola]